MSLSQSSPIDYNYFLCGADVTLDPFPFGGGVTLSDSIQCEVPFVTLPERQDVHRIGNGIAEHMNLTGAMTAHDLESYVAQAIHLADSKQRQHSPLDSQIRSTKDALFRNSEVNAEWRVLMRQIGRSLEDQ
jgi:predicted O-linked N-acetylglucosamine transferase (SPINDLY family)